MSEAIQTTRNLEVKLTAAELKAKGRELAEQELALQAADETKRADAAANRETVKGIKKLIASLATAVDSGVERRDVPCEKRPNYQQGCWEVVRLDTKEVIDTEAMSAEDRQVGMRLV